MLDCVWEKRVAGLSAWTPFLFDTHVGGFLLRQLKFLLGVFESLGVLVQLILSSLQLLLQSYQIVLELWRRCCVGENRWPARSGGKGEVRRERAQGRMDADRQYRWDRNRTEEQRDSERRGKERLEGSCRSWADTLVATSSAVSSFSSAVWNSSNTLSLSSSVMRNCFSNSLISSSNYTCN